MTGMDVALLLAVLGGTTVLASLVARWTGDAVKDTLLMFGVGAGLLAGAGAIYVV